MLANHHNSLLKEKEGNISMSTIVERLLVWLCCLTIAALDVLMQMVSLAWLKPLFAKAFRGRAKLQSVAVGKATATHGVPRRSAMHSKSLVRGDAPSVYHMVRGAVREFGNDHIAMVSRTFVKLQPPSNGQRFPTKIFDDSKLERLTYTQVGENITYFGAGLRALGMEPIPNLDPKASFDDLEGPFVMVLFEDTCKQWTIAMQGAFSQSMTVATCYSTLGHDSVVSAVNETNAATLLVNWKKVEVFSKLADQMPSLRTIIASTNEMPKGTKLPAIKGTIRIISSDEVIQLGTEKSIAPTPPKPDDVAVIMYTSGSTGKPKGVLMKHSQLVAGVSGMAMNLDIRRGKEVFVSYLPLAHILALQVENGLLSYGAKICYSDPRQIAKTLPLYRPTLFAGVPKVWDLLKAGVEKKLSAQPVVKLLFDTLMPWKRSMLRLGLDTPVSNVLFKGISKKLFGGVLRYGVSGGGPMSQNLQEFCRACFCCPIVQGYALTETCVGGCFQALHDARMGIVGPPVPCVEIMLQSEPEIKDSAGLAYLHTDSKNNKGEVVIGRGEICFRGPCVSSGYYKLPGKTKEEYDDEGWFHSGDVGEYTADGCIQIVDRKKNLVKLAGGEYVALESMESAFGESPFVSALCVVANGDLDTPLAIVNANNEYLEQWAKENRLHIGSLEDVADSKQARLAVIESMKECGKRAGLTSLELRIKDCCVIVGEDWGPGSGMTASMKIDRKKILEMHKDVLDAMFKRVGVAS